jgi:outer membrane protein OmpA-like peptidoglycan-associated protein
MAEIRIPVVPDFLYPDFLNHRRNPMKRAIVLCSLLALAACVPAAPPLVPPPPGPIAAAPVGARMFTVFFDWNRSTVGPQGEAILLQAAAVYKSGGVASVQVTGFADTSGSVRYNQKLSERRAQAVAHVLVRMGVPPQAVAFGGAGENNLAVPTPDGVREPRNRRVTVIE